MNAVELQSSTPATPKNGNEDRLLFFIRFANSPDPKTPSTRSLYVPIARAPFAVVP